MYKILLTLFLNFCYSVFSKAQNQALYYFDNGFLEFTEKYPALMPIGEKGSFGEETVEKFGKQKRKVYLIPANSGLMFDNSKTKNFIKNSYGIEMYFRYDNGDLLIYNQLLGSNLASKQGQYVHLVTTREAKSKAVNVFVNGKLAFNFSDKENAMEIDNNSQIDFFYEEGRETTTGAVAMIKLYDYFIDENEAENIFKVFNETAEKETYFSNGTLKNLYFVQSLPKFLPESLPELENLFDFLQNKPNQNIEIQGHTDNQGDFNLNLKLSKERAAAVKNFLIDKGISTKRITTKGFGSTKPVASNADELSRRKNRRVEIILN